MPWSCFSNLPQSLGRRVNRLNYSCIICDPSQVKSYLEKKINQKCLRYTKNYCDVEIMALETVYRLQSRYFSIHLLNKGMCKEYRKPVSFIIFLN